MIFPGFVGPAYRSQSPIADAQALMNWYPEAIESGAGKAQAALYPAPGFQLFASLGMPYRGSHWIGSRLFVAGFDRLYEYMNTGTKVDRGAIPAGHLPVQFTTNGVDIGELFFTVNTIGMRYDLTTNAAPAAAVAAAEQCGFVDGYFLALDPETSTLRVSDLNDGTTWSASMRAVRTQAPDRWRALLVAHGDVWLFGEETSEVWAHTGNGEPPFDYIPGAFLQYGIAAAFSAAILDNAPTWLARSRDGTGVVVRAEGFSPVRISDHAIEHAIQGYTTITDAEAWTYQQDGHSFYVLNFPTEGKTWVYDAATQQWHERGFWDAAANTFRAYRPRGHVFAFGKHLVGDRMGTGIYEMRTDLATEMDGNGIRRVRRAPHVSNEAKRVFYPGVQIDMETGLGLVSGQGSDPQAMFRLSRDGGQTWGPERLMSVGARGQYRTRVLANRLGCARDVVVEFSVSDPIPWRIVGAYLADPVAGLH